MARHRHAVSVRTDGLAAVLGPLLADPRIRSAALIDADSGMVLDVCGPDTAAGRYGSGRASEHDHRDEVRGAAHAEMVRIGLALAPGSGGVLGLVLEAGPDRHVLHTVPDPHGGRLALSVVVRGPDRVVAKVRKRLRAVSESALTAGPSVAVRPGSAGWTVPGAAGAQPAGSPAGPAPHGGPWRPGLAPDPHGPSHPGIAGPAGPGPHTGRPGTDPRDPAPPRPATDAASSRPTAAASSTTSGHSATSLPSAPSIPAALPAASTPAPPTTDPVAPEPTGTDGDAGAEGTGTGHRPIEATAPYAATAPSGPWTVPADRTVPGPTTQGPTTWPGQVAPLSAMLPSPRPRADGPEAPADPADPAPAER